MDDEHKARGDQLQDPELISLKSGNFEGSMMAVLKYLEEIIWKKDWFIL